MSAFDPTAARLAILETLNRYTWGYDVRDLALLGDTFTADAVFTIELAGHAGWGPYQGRQAIVDWLAGIMQTQSDQRRHCVSNHLFRTLGAAGATVDSYLTLFAVENGSPRLVATGTYRDELVDDDGAWRIRRKTLALDCAF
jgi:hypothetical protein